MPVSRESKRDHVRRLRQMYDNIATAAKPLSQVPDKTESMLYEPVDSILNFLRLRTDQRLSVSPVRRLLREYLADVNEQDYDIGGDWSMEANTSLDTSPPRSVTSDAFVVVEKNQIPDFTVFQRLSDTDRPPRMIVEVKPLLEEKTLATARAIVNETTWQILRQVMHAFELEGDFGSVHVLCIVGEFFSMTSIDRRHKCLLPPCEEGELEDSSLPEQTILNIRSFYGATADALVSDTARILNGTKTDYSTAFRKAWNGFASQYGLQCDWASA